MNSSSNRGKGRSLKPARKLKLVPSVKPGPKVVRKVYTNVPVAPKVKNIEAERCGINPLNTVLSASILNLDHIAGAIVGHLNHAKGAVPVAGTVYNAGAVSLYLNQCLYAYMVRAGIVQGDITVALNFAKYRVPTLVATLFQHCAPYEDKKLGNTITLKFPNFTSTFLNSLSKSEAVGQMWVSESPVPGFGGETTFGPGSSVTIGSYLESEWSALSDWIGSGFETVPVTEIGLKAPSHYGLITRGASFSSIKPIIGNMAYFCIVNVATPLGPHRSPFPLVHIDNLGLNGSVYDQILWGYAMWSTSHLKYTPDLTPSIVFKRQKLNPLTFSIQMVPQSIPKMCLNIIDFMIQMGNLNSSNPWNAGTIALFLYMLSSSYARAISQSPFFCHINSLNIHTIPQYGSPLWLKAKVPAYEVCRGFEPTRSHDTVIAPWFEPPSYTVLNALQPSAVITANYGTLGNLNNALGYWPFSCTVPTYTFCGQAPLSQSVYTNVVPLRMIEEIEAYAQQTTTLFANNTLSVVASKEFCPCGVVHLAGANNFSAASGLVLTYPLIPYMWCTRAVDTLACKMTASTSLNNMEITCLFLQPIYDSSQNCVRAASESSHLNNNVTTFNMAGATPGALAKSVFDSVAKSMLGDSEKVNFTISGKQLIQAAKSYAVEGGVLSSPPPPNFWNEVLSNSYNLYELVSKTASGVQYVTPAVLGAVEAAKVLHTYKPLLSLV